MLLDDFYVGPGGDFAMDNVKEEFGFLVFFQSSLHTWQDQRGFITSVKAKKGS
jgi:hypothetical protein